MPQVDAIEIVEDRTASSRCDEGFLHVRRYRALNRRIDGTRSAVYRIDVLDRPSLDAVAVCLWARTPRGVEVLLRRQLRPAVLFRRGKVRALPEAEPLLYEEIVAGLVEAGEQGLAALRRRGAEEAREEAGLEIDPARLAPLGAAFYTLPGIVSEKIHLLEVEVPRGDAAGEHDAPLEGDGSPLEEGATLLWRGLDEAIAACESGEIEDAKSELAFRRLRDRLRG
jgi:ADP-ribose pyrophosphatase